MASEPEELFRLGNEAFNAREFFDAHEHWEDLWTDHHLPDANFIQGLIQLTVGCFHLTNANLNGARGLFTKCIRKLEPYQPARRGLDVTSLVAYARRSLEQIEGLTSAEQFDWSGLPRLEVDAEEGA
ncbi:MAG: DUF309 domain-containing protein [Candidatus Marinimicrobia bacterium]|nr:DUF309 domain-containing protein [Candidatus Neomarinimicrobiota bacterium]